jgi:glucose/arabinose dehydrogenase
MPSDVERSASMNVKTRKRVAALGATAVATLGIVLGVDALIAAAPHAPPRVVDGFKLETIAHVRGPRELAVSPGGDLYIGTLGDAVVVIAHATGDPAPPRAFARIDDRAAAGVALANGTLFVGSLHGIWRVPLGGPNAARPQRIANVRAEVDGGHGTTSVAVAGERLYASVGSSCNACVETDPSRATVLAMHLDGSAPHPVAVRIRNAVALGVDPATNDVWAGVAGQDDLEHGHPYEIFDDVTAAAATAGGTADYAWPDCFEDRRPTQPGNDCRTATVPRAVFPAYETPVGAAMYPTRQSGPYAFPPPFRGGFFVALHGSWHTPLVPPRVVFVPFRDGNPARPVDWNDPAAQWVPFVEGFQALDGTRSGRPTGVAVGPDGSLFVADDDANAVYRIRPERAR